MFRQIAFSTATGPSTTERENAANALLQRHPIEIASLLESVWNRRPPAPGSDVDL